MKAERIFSRRVVLTRTTFVEIVVWEVPEPLDGSNHCYKYSLALVCKGICVMRYDNEAGKGDHRHLGEDEYPYQFTDVDQLIHDFLEDVRRWQNEHGNT